MEDRDRLAQIARAGDEGAAHQLLQLGIRRNDRPTIRLALSVLGHERATSRFIDAMELMGRQPSASSWRKIVGKLSTWPEAEGLSWAIDFFNGLLESWPTHLRLANWRWWFDLEEGKHLQLWALARRLVLEGARLTVNKHYQLASTPELVFIQSMALEATRAGDEGLHALLESPFLTRLQELELPFSDLTEEGTSALVSAGSLPSLQRLNLSANPLGDAGVGALGRTHGKDWKRLLLTHCDVGDAGVSKLVSGSLELASIDLSSNRVGDASIEQLAASRSAKTLTSLSLASNQISDGGLATVAASEWPHLQVLDLRDNAISDEGVALLARSGGLRQLVCIDLGANSLTPASHATLRRSRNLPNLQEIALGRGSDPKAMNAGRTSALGNALKRALHDE